MEIFNREKAFDAGEKNQEKITLPPLKNILLTPLAGTHVETRCDVTSILKVGSSLPVYLTAAGWLHTLLRGGGADLCKLWQLDAKKQY